jgi:hypothetical protein
MWRRDRVRFVRPASRPVKRVASQQLDWVSTHEHAQVVFGLGKQTVRIDELEALVALEGIQLVHVAVHQHGLLVEMRPFPPAGTGKGVLERLLRAGVIELYTHADPHCDQSSVNVGILIRVGQASPRLPAIRDGVSDQRRGSSEDPSLVACTPSESLLSCLSRDTQGKANCRP